MEGSGSKIKRSSLGNCHSFKAFSDFPFLEFVSGLTHWVVEANPEPIREPQSGNPEDFPIRPPLPKPNSAEFPIRRQKFQIWDFGNCGLLPPHEFP